MDPVCAFHCGISHFIMEAGHFGSGCSCRVCNRLNRVYDSLPNENCQIAITPKAVYVEWPLCRMETRPKIVIK